MHLSAPITPCKPLLKHFLGDVRLYVPAGLSQAHLERWHELQRENAGLQSPYFRPEFTQAVARVRSDVEVAVFEARGEIAGFLPFQRGQLNMGKPVGGKLCDFHGCIAASDFLFEPQQLLAKAKLAAWDFEHVPAGQATFLPFATNLERAPGLELKDGYEGWCEMRRAQGSQIVSKTMQKVRKLAREQGELSLELCSDAAAVMDQLVAWKSAQYQESGLTDLFTFPWTRALIDELWTTTQSEFGGWLSVLRAGQRIVAITYSLRSRHVMHAWFTAYDRTLASYSPGLIQFLKLAEALPTVGITRFELGKGDERFKWNLSTDSQELLEGSIARRSLATWLRGSWRNTRDWVSRSPLASTVDLIKPLRQWFEFK
jgi:CelD/BcsL family acetyltransferase involved in cellulose biosynthesis